MSQKIKLSRKQRKQLRLAQHELKFAHARVYESARGAEPFEISKLLNVMGKILGDYDLLLSILVGDHKAEFKPFEQSFETPPLRLFKVYLKNRETR